jgi:hypothetical protein
LRSAIHTVRPEQPQPPLPAQLRYREEVDFRALFRASGLSEPVITTATAQLEAPSARWLAERVGFAPACPPRWLASAIPAVRSSSGW